MPVLGAGAVQASAPGLSPVPRRRVHIPELEEAEQFAAGRGRALRLLEALYQCVAAHSELLCYFVIVLNHIYHLTAAAFLWTWIYIFFFMGSSVLLLMVVQQLVEILVLSQETSAHPSTPPS